MCGLSTRKTLTPGVDPVQDDVEPRLPQAAPVGRVPVDVVDVLVALGRVLGVLERAVGAAVEPLRVLGQPRVVGRGVDREVERDVDAVLARGAQSARTSSSVPSSGWTASWPPSVRADRVRRAGVVGRRRRARCCGPCGSSRRSGGSAAGRGRRSRARRSRQLLLDALQAAPRAREQLVPGAEARRATRSTSSAQRRLEARRARGARRCARPPRRARGRARRRAWPPRARGVARARERVLDQLAVGALGARAAACSSSTTPSESSPARSCWPASSLRCSSSRQVAKTSVQASIVNSQRPSGRRRTSPAQRTPLRCASSGRSSASAQRRLPGAAVADDGAQLVVAVAEDVGRDLRRGRRRSAWPGSGRRRRPGAGTGSGSAAGRSLACFGAGIRRREYPP